VSGLQSLAVHERKRAPTHPGAIIKHECMEPLSLSVTALAEVCMIEAAATRDGFLQDALGDGR